MFVKLFAVVSDQNDQTIVVEIEITEEVQKDPELPVCVTHLTLVQGAEVRSRRTIFPKSLFQKNLRIVELGRESSGLPRCELPVTFRGIVDSVRIPHMNIGEHRPIRVLAVEKILPK